MSANGRTSEMNRRIMTLIMRGLDASEAISQAEREAADKRKSGDR